MKILITRNLPGNHLGRLNAYYSDVRIVDKGRPLSKSELMEQAPGTQVLLCTVANKIDSEVLGRFSDLKCVITYSVGVDHIDVEELKRRSIPLSHTPDVLTIATAELAFGLLITGARRMKAALRNIEDGQFFGVELFSFLGKSLAGSTLGIIGMGRIGQAVAQRATAFGMKILYVSPSSKQLGFAARRVGLADLLQQSDFVSLHCPSTASNHHMIGRKELGIMKEDAVLVNTARGSLIDEEALVAHLRSHPEFEVGLDVYEKEPAIAPGLVALPNSFCLPHIGSAEKNTRYKMAEMVVEEAIRFLRSEDLQFLYKKEAS